MFSITFIDNVDLFNGLFTGKWLGFEIAFLTASFAICIISLTQQFPKQTFGVTDLIFLLFVVYTFTRTNTNHVEALRSSSFYLAGTVCVWGYMKNAVQEQLLTVAFALYLLAAIGQAAIGLMQIYGFYDSHHALFTLTGTFHNPGPYAGCLASAIPLSLSVILTKRTKHKIQKPNVTTTECSSNHMLRFAFRSKHLLFSLPHKQALGIIGQIAVILLLLVLPATRSRAAWVGALAGSLFVYWPYIQRLYYYMWKRRLRKFNFLRNRQTLWGLLVVVGLACATGLYFLKKDSANGRWLMWQVSWQLIKEEPLIGHGWNAFGAKYMNEQAKWFASGKGSEALKAVAGEPEAPFNEPIRLLVEFGWSGLFLIGVFFTVLIAYIPSKRKSIKANPALSTSARGIGGAIVSIIAFSLFSYPMDIAPTWHNYWF
ncbi:MAG: O-antigen ligase family protein [Breznakibacter sp.]